MVLDIIGLVVDIAILIGIIKLIRDDKKTGTEDSDE